MLGNNRARRTLRIANGALHMSSQQQIQQYLLKAADADSRAAAVVDPASKTDWANIALGYRDLARLVRTTAVMDELSDRPLREPSPE